MEGWVDLGYPAIHRMGVELAISRSLVRRPDLYRATRTLNTGRMTNVLILVRSWLWIMFPTTNLNRNFWCDNWQGCRGYGNSHGNSHGYIGMGWVWERWWIPMGTLGILWEFLSDCEIKRKRVNYAINVAVDVSISSNSQILNLFQWHFWIFLHYRIIAL